MVCSFMMIASFTFRYFILENVRNFATFKKSAILRMCLKVLLGMGYSCTFGILQAGHFGVAQTRRRLILLAAAPGQELPQYPEPQHVFATTSLSAQIGDKVSCVFKIERGNQSKSSFFLQVCVSNCKWTESAPYRTITVRDTMSDLPEICNGQMNVVMDYDTVPISHFQV